MKEGYRLLGDFIRQVDVRNTDGKEENLLGVSVQKVFIPSIANTVGTDFTKYKVVKRGQFTYIPDTSRRGDKIGIALLTDYDEGLVSNIYTVFEVKDENELLPEYLMLWFSRPEFDRYARFKSHGSVREIMDWDEMCKVELPVDVYKRQVLDLVDKGLVTDQMVLTVGYDIENLTDPARRAKYHGAVETDHYGRQIPKQAHGSINLDGHTSSTRKIMCAVSELFDRIVDKNLLVRRMYVVANHVLPEADVPKKNDGAVQLDLFTDYAAEEEKQKAEDAALERERKIQAATLAIKKKYGKNAILKAMNLEEGATAKDRNAQIGGHKA